MKQTSITPFLVVKNGAQAIDFYSKAFGAQVLSRFDQADHRLMAEISIDGAVFWLSDEEPEFDNLSPDTIKGSPVRIILTVADPDMIFPMAIESGAIQICPLTTEEHWRIGKLKDPFGHIWEIGCPLEES